MRYILVAFFIAFLGGCAKYIETDISVFHDMRFPPSGISYAVVPAPEQENSLEFQSYAQLLKAQLDKLGMHEVPLEKASYMISMSYGVDNGREVFSSTPVYGQTGIWGSYSTVALAKRAHTATYTGMTFSTPLYTQVGTQTRSEVLFSRFLTIDIVDIQNNTVHKVYEAKALSIGDTAMLVSVIPAMIQSVFEEFPGLSGATRKSKIALPDQK